MVQNLAKSRKSLYSIWSFNVNYEGETYVTQLRTIVQLRLSTSRQNYALVILQILVLLYLHVALLICSFRLFVRTANLARKCDQQLLYINISYLLCIYNNLWASFLHTLKKNSDFNEDSYWKCIFEMMRLKLLGINKMLSIYNISQLYWNNQLANYPVSSAYYITWIYLPLDLTDLWPGVVDLVAIINIISPK